MYDPVEITIPTNDQCVYSLDSLDLCPQGKDAISPALKTKLNAEGSEVSQIMGQLKLPAPDELPLASNEE